MSFLAILAIAVGLAMDAFAVSLGIGLNAVPGEHPHDAPPRLALRPVPVLHADPRLVAGLTFARWITSVDHWIAFGLLAAIGGKMIYEALWGDEEKRAEKDATRGSSLVVLSVATSIDALAVGLSLALLGVRIWYPAVVIGVVAFAFTAAGLHLGCRFGSLLGKRMEVVGGLILIAIGVKILVDHLF